MHAVKVTILGALLVLTQASAQTTPGFTTLYNFAGYPTDASAPYAGVIRAANGVLYGTTREGPSSGISAVYSLSPPAVPGGVWTESIIHAFNGGDGYDPYAAGVVIGLDGALYGTTAYGGANVSSSVCPAGCGVVYQLTPPSKRGGAWTETTLYSFAGADGRYPYSGVAVDAAGNLYGTTMTGGVSDAGTVFKLSPPSSPGGPWTESILYDFGTSGGGDDAQPGVLLGPNGAIYGATTFGGPQGFGNVFALTPSSTPGAPWTETVIHTFTGPPGDGQWPQGNLALDANGVLYGSCGGGANNRGMVFAATPPATPGGAWGWNIIHNFTKTEGADPIGGLTIGRGGVIYGSTFGNLKGKGGTIFALQPPATAGGDWTSSVLHVFAPGTGQIEGSLLVAPGGAIYGTTSTGGISSTNCAFESCGTVFMLVP